MNKLKLIFFYFSPALILFANDIVRSYIRPIYGLKKYGVLSIILGWLPNYFAGLGFVLLGLIIYKLILDYSKDNNYYRSIYIYMTLIGALSATGLIWWEFEQRHGRLFFDNNDNYATIGGVLCGYLIFVILMLKNFLRPTVQIEM